MCLEPLAVPSPPQWRMAAGFARAVAVLEPEIATAIALARRRAWALVQVLEQALALDLRLALDKQQLGQAQVLLVQD